MSRFRFFGELRIDDKATALLAMFEAFPIAIYGCFRFVVALGFFKADEAVAVGVDAVELFVGCPGTRGGKHRRPDCGPFCGTTGGRRLVLAAGRRPSNGNARKAFAAGLQSKAA